MREIKFRGKTININKWIFGYYFYKYIPATHHKAQIDTHIIVDIFGNEHEIISEIIGQYIGLKDKNGNEIYEGDIVKVPATLNDNINILYVVFKKGSFLYWSPNQDNGVFVSKIDNNTIEIIGNIQDNPKLLKQI